MGEVIELDIVTRLDIPPEKILRKAAKKELTDVLVIGWDAAGDFYFASSMAAGPDCLWLIKLAEKGLMEVGSAGVDD